ncbi:MAG: hypothetical protein J2P59_00200 [Acidimicrobiales bacterium]|nr:hypothetical protein [Acidimicrobiales bacterium]
MSGSVHGSEGPEASSARAGSAEGAHAPARQLSPMELATQLEVLRNEMRRRHSELAHTFERVHPCHRQGAANLVDYLTLRRHDMRSVQQALAELGLSSLGRAEEHVVTSIEQVIAALHGLAGCGDGRRTESAVGFGAGTRALESNGTRLLGPAPRGRATRILVTMPPGGGPRRFRIGCSLPQALDAARPGDRVFFDDGRIGGVILAVRPGEADVRINMAACGGSKLRAEKGINLPDSELHLPALDPADEPILRFVARHADLVGLSFAQRPADVAALQRRLRELGRPGLGIVLKVETAHGFAALPELILKALESERVGVMVARGDLAVECGFERLAEVQEEMLWLCDSAHVPVIWATEVLDRDGEDGPAIARGGLRCRHGRAGRVRHAQQRPLHPRCGGGA